MSTTTRFAAILLTLVAVTSPARAQQGEGTSAYTQPIYRVAYRDTGVPAPSAPRVVAEPPAPAEEAPHSCPHCARGGAATAGDPYGFAAVLNSYRAMAGLPPVAYDPNLSAWASQNNAAQSRRGLGHHVNPNCFQNCGWNYQDVVSVARGWMNSPGHRRNMLSPSITRFGIAYGPGPYWTMNAQ